MKPANDVTNPGSKTAVQGEVAGTEAGLPARPLRLVDVSWLVGNLYLDEADKEKLILRRQDSDCRSIRRP
jgi:hypothetical protein